jgi:hypothetical protein
MKRFWIEYSPTWTPAPLSFWVRVHLDGDRWSNATVFSPPLPRLVPGKGYPTYFIEYRDVRLRFASVEELDVFVDILGRRVLPTTRALSVARGVRIGPNSHWLSRLPAKLKPWRIRQALIHWLRGALSKHFAEDGEDRRASA